MTATMPYRSFRVRVDRTVRLSPSFLRVTFSSGELKHFGTDGLDQRVKLVFPLPETGFGDFGLLDNPPVSLTEWYGKWRALDDAERNTIRTYTIRKARPETHEVDIDFVLHGDCGPASAWAASAAPGDEIVIVGPDSRSDQQSGIEWRPGTAKRVLIGGDETAMPAIAAIVESLPAGLRGSAFIEVPHQGDILEISNASDLEIVWLPRGNTAPGSVLTGAIREWTSINLTAKAGSEPEEIDTDSVRLWEVPELPNSDFYSWLAGESAMIMSLRRHLVRDIGLDRHQVAFMGYWRAGRAES